MPVFSFIVLLPFAAAATPTATTVRVLCGSYFFIDFLRLSMANVSSPARPGCGSIDFPPTSCWPLSFKVKAGATTNGRRDDDEQQRQ
jgi:hypothetical protein